MKLDLLLVRLVAAGWSRLYDLIALVELRDLALQFLLLPIDPFLQRQLIVFVSVLGMALVIRVVGVPACLELLSAALIAVVVPRRALRGRGVVVVVAHL